MTTVVTKKVRLTREEARRLRNLARARKTTESDILRQGLEMVDLRARRMAAAEGLIGLIQGKEPPKMRIRFRENP